LSAGEFAASIGVKASTLSYWAWRVGREQRLAADAVKESLEPVAARRTAFVEVIAGGGDDERFELELGNARRLRIPPRFKADALQRLLAVLEGERR